MQALFIGGIKSGKSKNAERYTLNLADEKPYYLATTEFIDEEMQQRIALHKQQRAEQFITLEEPLALAQTLQTLTGKTVLVECVSMWLNNMLHHKRSKEEILAEIEQICSLNLRAVFVLNDVGNTVVSTNKLVRDFVDLSGIISQKLSTACSEVYHVHAGISVRIK